MSFWGEPLCCSRWSDAAAGLNDHLGESLRPTYEISDERDQLRPTRLPRGVSLMVIRVTVMWVDVDTDGGSVLDYRAGRRPAVELIEGCA